MNRWCICLVLVLLFVLALPHDCPAPLIYRAGEGWTYEAVGGGKWERARAKDQLDVAQTAFDQKHYGVALKASRRVVLGLCAQGAIFARPLLRGQADGPKGLYGIPKSARKIS
jgi:hypothetical protein